VNDGELAKDFGPLAALDRGRTTIGAGIVVLPGQAAAVAGPVVPVPFVAGVVSVFTALSTVRGHGPADADRVAEGIDCPVLRPSGHPVGASGSDADD